MRTREVLAAAAFVSISFFGAPVVGSSTSDARRHDDRATLVVRVVDENGRTIPARVRVQRQRISGRWRTITIATADERPARFAMSERTVRVVATHGPEWSIASREVELHDGRETALRFVLVRQVDRAPFISADLHVHTDASPDGTISLDERMRTVFAEDLDHIVLTDHNVATEAPPGDVAVTGVEVTSHDPEIGHFNAFPMDRVPRFRNTTASAIFADVHSTPGAMVQINHPRLQHHLAYFELAELTSSGQLEPGFSLDADLLEVWNGYDLARRSEVSSLFAEWLRLRSQGHPMIATGGSDSHGMREQMLGMPRTYLHVRHGETWIDALRRGSAFVSNGPILDVRIGDARPGDVVPLTARTRTSVAIEVRAAPAIDVRWLEVFRGPARVARLEIDRSPRAVRYTGHVVVDVSPGDELVVRAIGERTMDDLADRPDVEPCAFTNPIRFLSPTNDGRNPSPASRANSPSR